MTSKRILTIVLAVLTTAASSAGLPRIDYKKLNRQASKRYEQPVRPGYEGRNPFWNGFSTKFTYAPAFEFQPQVNVSDYRFTVCMADTADSRSWSFTASTPSAPLTPIWKDIPAGNVILRVEALDGKGNATCTVGERRFLRDFEFEGPYREAVRPYREAAIIGLLHTHNMPAIQNWKTAREPDMSYVLNCYPAKMVSATIENEVLLARLCPRYRKDAEAIARGAARFLMSQCRGKDEPLACFPPTYWGNKSAARLASNKNKVMIQDAVFMGNAMLELYDLTGDGEYFDHAIGIADTYRRIQAEDGSMPIKADFITGQSINNVKAMLAPMIKFFDRLHDRYGIDDYLTAQKKAEEWMQRHVLNSFDMTGQFEDISVEGLRPYENLTNSTAAPYAEYLLRKKDVTEQETADALDIIDFCEDQFLRWNSFPDADGIHRLATPCVYEQYKFRVPINGSSNNIARAFIAAYEKTRDKLYLAKAKALVDNLNILQNGDTGRMPTNVGVNVGADHVEWINCSLGVYKMFLEWEEFCEKEQRQ